MEVAFLFGPEHINLAGNLNNLYFLYLAQEKFADAELLAIRALAIADQAFAGKNRDVAPAVSLALNALTEIYMKQGAFYKGRDFSKMAMEFTERVLGLECPILISVYENHVELINVLERSSGISREDGEELLALHKRIQHLKDKLQSG